MRIFAFAMMCAITLGLSAPASGQTKAKPDGSDCQCPQFPYAQEPDGYCDFYYLIYEDTCDDESSGVGVDNCDIPYPQECAPFCSCDVPGRAGGKLSILTEARKPTDELQLKTGVETLCRKFIQFPIPGGEVIKAKVYLLDAEPARMTPPSDEARAAKLRQLPAVQIAAGFEVDGEDFRADIIAKPKDVKPAAMDQYIVRVGSVRYTVRTVHREPTFAYQPATLEGGCRCSREVAASTAHADP